LIRLGAFSLIADGLFGFALVILEARQSFAAISTLSILQAALRAGLIAALFFAKRLNLYALLILESVVPLAAFIYSTRLIPRSFFILRRPVLEHLGLLFHFTKWIAIAALASTIFLKLDVLMLSLYRASVEVGLYAAAFALVTKLDVVKGAVLTTAFPEACRRTERSDLRAFVFQSLRLTGLATLLALPLFGVGGLIIEWLYGTSYRAAIPTFYPLLAAFLIGLNAEPVAYVLYPLNQPRWIAASDVIQLVFCAAVNLILIPSFGMIGAAWGVLLTRGVAALITFGLVRRFLWERGAA
jgi:O-antigen/teichoic acid export membrane protein